MEFDTLYTVGAFTSHSCSPAHWLGIIVGESHFFRQHHLGILASCMWIFALCSKCKKVKIKEIWVHCWPRAMVEARTQQVTEGRSREERRCKYQCWRKIGHQCRGPARELATYLEKLNGISEAFRFSKTGKLFSERRDHLKWGTVRALYLLMVICQIRNLSGYYSIAFRVHCSVPDVFRPPFILPRENIDIEVFRSP